jgi:hypothetical protein
VRLVAFGCVLIDRLYKFSKRFSGMYTAARNFKIPAFFCQLVIDLVSVCDHSSGKSLQEFLRVFRMTGRMPVKENDRMCVAQRLVPIKPHIGLLTVVDLCMVDLHGFYRTHLHVSFYCHKSGTDIYRYF